MKEVFYKGKPYQFRMFLRDGVRHFDLFENDVFKYSVEENELDIKSLVSLILDSYYRNVKPVSKSAAVG